MSGFQVFYGKYGTRDITKDPCVDVGRTGQLVLSGAAFELAGGPEHVELLYDPDIGRVGIRNVTGRPPRHAYRVTRQGNDRWTINGSAFVKHNCIDIGDGVTSRRWPVELIDDGEGGKVLCAGISQPGIPLGATALKRIT